VNSLYSVQNCIIERKLCGTCNTRSVNIQYVRTQRGVKVTITHLLSCTTRSESIPTFMNLNLDSGQRWAVGWCRPIYHRFLLNTMLE